LASMKEPKRVRMGREFPHTDQILLLSAALFFALWIFDSFVLGFSARLVGFVPNLARVVLFLGFEIASVVLGFLSHEALFSKKRVNRGLITEGVFAHARHPLYLSILLAYLGFVFGSMSLVSLVPWICYAILFNRMATYEEQDLVRIFGDECIAYRSRVPKWIPSSTSAKTKETSPSSTKR
jgi:protein-S-isoprenylcysteine O-methyltransferase Ste14